MTLTDDEAEAFPYTSAQAFGAAITGRFRSLAAGPGRSASQLRRQFAYDRLLARLFVTGPQEWILKGGVSMIARLASARHTADVDKVMAIIETHHGRPSTRFRDLVDLVLIAHSQQVRAEDLAAAVTSERLRRDLARADVLAVPNEELWRTGYQTLARDVPGVAEKSLADALMLVKRFVDPVLAGTACGVWDPAALAWQRPNDER